MQTIVTHSGAFHPDDVLSVAALTIYLGELPYEIIRSRTKEVIEKADWVIDVGGEYDVERKRFDHHQVGAPVRENGVPYSAFGLVWKEIGEEICGSAAVSQRIEHQLVIPVDAADNQVVFATYTHPDIQPFELYDVLNTFKPTWGTDEDFDIGFMRAVSFARKLIKRQIAQEEGYIAMHALIQQTYDESENKQLLVFESPMIRSELADYSDVAVFVSPVFSNDSNNWMAVAVPTHEGSQENRAALPSQWAGLTDDELEAVSGITGAVFCHKSLYIFVAKTKTAALEAAAQCVIH